MMVYRSHFASKVHFDPECPAWNSSKSARGPLLEIDIREAKGTKFCRTCTPERLHRRPQTIHELCPKCRWKRPMPCRHNGGVPVVNVDTVVRYGKAHRRVNVRWRWPEMVLGAPIAPWWPMV